MQEPVRYNPQELRRKFIKELHDAQSASDRAKELADDLFALDLTVYSSNFSFDSIVYNAFAQSELDDRISLHPEQLNIIQNIYENLALIISAPTSFGKTFCIFEYIVKYSPKNVVLIVPTLALVDEYFKKIVKRYRKKFSEYKVHTNISENKEYDFDKHNIFILTHDRVVQETMYQKIEEIDFLVIDEVYKLETDKADDRVLILNMAYFYLSKRAKKYVLLAPFIKEVLDTDKLDKNPKFYRSEYSPVVNEIITRKIIREEDRFIECQHILEKIKSEEKTLIYFPTVTSMYKYITSVIINEPKIENIDDDIYYFLEWAREEIHEDWCLIKALERGYLLHNGQIPVGTRIIQLDNYDKSDTFNKMLCTATLLEGVNTTAKNIIITKPARKRATVGEHFSAFDFYNLVGRTGRLNEHLIGNAYYIQAPMDPDFDVVDAVRSIRFEITDDSEDIDIQQGNIGKHKRVKDFLHILGISLMDYQENIGTKLRFQTVLDLYYRYISNKDALINKLSEMSENELLGRYYLISILYTICEGKNDKLDSSIINALLNKRRPRIKKVVDDTKDNFNTIDINTIISKTINLKSSYIEHQFFNKVNIIRYFLLIDKTDISYMDVLDNKVLGAIEYLYFTNIKNKKVLIDLGIYERDVDKIIKVIGDDFEDVSELKVRLTDNYSRFKDISYISRYIIKSLI